MIDEPASRRAYEQLMGLETECVRAEQSINARQGSTMILAYHAPCWRGRHGIRIWVRGSALPYWHDGRASRAKISAGRPLHDDCTRLCDVEPPVDTLPGCSHTWPIEYAIEIPPDPILLDHLLFTSIVLPADACEDGPPGRRRSRR